MKILYDGWPLIYRPQSPAALHLMTLLKRRPVGVQAFAALPADPPAWLPDGVVPWIRRIPNTTWKRLLWEHRLLPGLARQTKADLVHLTTPGPALFCPARCAISPSGGWEGDEESTGPEKTPATGEPGHPERRPGLIERLRRSMDQGGAARLRGVFWPADLPYAGSVIPTPLFRLPPAVHPAFAPPGLFADLDLSALDLPDTYVLYHGPLNSPALMRLLNAWRWAAAAIGQTSPLVLLEAGETSRDRLNTALPDFSQDSTLRFLPQVPFPWLAEIYRSCAVLLHPGPISPWGSPIRHAFACGRPVAAEENALASALTGPAAYLAPAGDARGLGAAVITLLVEEEISSRLSLASRERALAWQSERFSQAIQEAYQAILNLS